MVCNTKSVEVTDDWGALCRDVMLRIEKGLNQCFLDADIDKTVQEPIKKLYA